MPVVSIGAAGTGGARRINILPGPAAQPPWTSAYVEAPARVYALAAGATSVTLTATPAPGSTLFTTLYPARVYYRLVGVPWTLGDTDAWTDFGTVPLPAAVPVTIGPVPAGATLYVEIVDTDEEGGGELDVTDDLALAADTAPHYVAPMRGPNGWPVRGIALALIARPGEPSPAPSATFRVTARVRHSCGTWTRGSSSTGVPFNRQLFLWDVEAGTALYFDVSDEAGPGGPVIALVEALDT